MLIRHLHQLGGSDLLLTCNDSSSAHPLMIIRPRCWLTSPKLFDQPCPLPSDQILSRSWRCSINHISGHVRCQSSSLVGITWIHNKILWGISVTGHVCSLSHPCEEKGTQPNWGGGGNKPHFNEEEKNSKKRLNFPNWSFGEFLPNGRPPPPLLGTPFFRIFQILA